MNKFIAGTFGSLLAILHALVIIGLALIIFGAYSEKEALDRWGIDPEASLPLAIGLFVGYVFFAGFVSTVVSINERLAEINEKMDNC